MVDGKIRAASQLRRAVDDLSDLYTDNDAFWNTMVEVVCPVRHTHSLVCKVERWLSVRCNNMSVQVQWPSACIYPPPNYGDWKRPVAYLLPPYLIMALHDERHESKVKFMPNGVRRVILDGKDK